MNNQSENSAHLFVMFPEETELALRLATIHSQTYPGVGHALLHTYLFNRYNGMTHGDAIKTMNKSMRTVRR